MKITHVVVDVHILFVTFPHHNKIKKSHYKMDNTEELVHQNLDYDILSIQNHPHLLHV